MNRFLPLLLLLLIFNKQILSQADDCLGAISLTPTANCSSLTSGSTLGLTQSSGIPSCVGNSDDDGWYKFVATSTTHYLTVSGSSNYDAVVQAFSGSCASLTSLMCVDNSLESGSELLNLTGLTVGNTYYFRVYDYKSGSGSSTYSICLTGPPTAPSNDLCANAISLTVGTSCNLIAGTTEAASQTMAGCSGNANDDVWYKFVANNYTQDITLECSKNFDGVVQLLTGACVTFTNLYCQDDFSYGGTETINATNLTIGTTYYVRVYEFGSGSGGTFSICVTGNPKGATQPNDDPCGAIQIPTVTSACNYVTFSNVGATSTSTVNAPLPSSCSGGSGGAGGFVAGTTKDVWFKITVPASGIISITPKPNQSTGWLTDASFALYSGSCGSLTQIACSRDYPSYPGAGDDLLPFYVTNTATPLAAGTTVYLRVWPDNSASTGNFAFCVQSPTNDECANALYICNLNGYSSSTSQAFTPDFPGTGSGQMAGNNDTPTSIHTAINEVDGTNTGGPFGYYPPSNVAGTFSSPLIDVNIENNSWIKFTAAATTANLKVVTGDCFVGGYPSGGLQMQIFSSTGCNNFFPVSNFKESSGNFTITATGLTIGNDYYLMVDGYANDICNYTIQALNGVSFPNIVATPTAVCAGKSSTLTAPAATSYSWMPGGATTQTIVVTPDKPLSTYTCIVEGVCGQKQVLTKDVVMNALPTPSINSNNPVMVCNGSSITLTASGASTYTWTGGPTGVNYAVSPTVNTTYTVKATSASGCTNTAVTNVTVNPVPSFTLSSSNTNTICFGQSTILTATGTAINYTWSPGGATTPTINVNPSTTTIYNVTGVNSQGCSKVMTLTLTVNPLPSLTSNSITICNGKTGTLTVNGASTYTWNTGVTGSSLSVNPSSTSQYTVTGTSSLSCTNSVAVQVSVTPTPTVTINSGTNIAMCNTQTITLNGGGATTYTWNTGATSNNISISPSSNTTYSIIGALSSGCTNTAITTVTVNSLPNITVSGTNTICPGKSTILSGNNCTTYTWTPGGTISQTISVSPASNTTYTVTGTDANNCRNTSSITVSVNSTPTISVNSTTLCNGANAVLTASSSASIFSWSTGSTASSISPSPSSSTNYTVVGTAANTCTNFAVAQVTVISKPSVAASSGTICLNKTFTLTGTGANTYTWSTGQNGTSISVTPTTTTIYTVSGTAVSTCTNANTVTVSVNALPQVTSGPSIAQSNCSTPTGSITGITTSGTPSLSPIWTTTAGVISTSWNLTNIPAQTYNLQITDGNGCVNNYAYTVTNPGAPAAPTVSATANSVCSGGSINLFANGASGVTYNWSSSNGYSSNNQNPIISNVTTAQTGTYAVSTSSAGCTGASASIVITVNPLPNPSAVTSQSAYCIGNTIYLSGSSANSYTWSGPGSYSANSQTTSITNSSSNTAGIYTLTVTDGNGCINSNTVNVTVNTNPIITASANPGIVCVGQTINLSANGGTNYSWTGPNSYTSSLQTPSISNASLNNGGDYTVTVTGANSCTSSAITSVSVNALPTFTSAVNSANICYGSTIQFNAGSNTNTYSWDGPNSFSVTNNSSPSISNASPLNSGTYTVTAGGGSCFATQTITVNVYPQISLNATATNTSICEGNTLQLLGSGANTYTWSGPGSFSSNNQNPQINNTQITSSGTYTFAITDANNCSTYTTIAIVVNANPTASASANPNAICAGQTINLNAGGGNNYSWTGPNGYSNSTQNPNIANAGSVYSGDYTVTVTDANFCSSQAITSVTVNSLPSYTWAANSNNVCFGDAIVLEASNTTYTVNWNGPNSYSASGANQTINNATTLNAGIYTVTASDANCSQSQTVSVNVYPQINMNASATSYVVCNGNTINLLGTGGGNYSWTGPNVFSSSNQNPQITNAQSNSSGIYSLTVTDITTNCTEKDTVLINIAPTPTLVSYSNGSTCYGNQLTLTADFGTGVSVNWYNDAALTNSVQTNSNNYQPNLTTDGTYIYYVQGSIGNCTSATETIIAQYNNVNAAAIADVYSGFTPLTVTFTNTSIGVTSTDYFNWNFGDGTNSNTFNTNHIFGIEGTYSVVLAIADIESGCADTTTIIIKVEDDFVIVVPNVFTPNGDNVNETFHIKIKGAKTAEGYIYNRWGQQLYSWDVLNAAWDGKASNGENCPDGTYYYLIKVIDKKDKEHLFPGYVLIAR